MQVKLKLKDSSYSHSITFQNLTITKEGVDADIKQKQLIELMKTRKDVLILMKSNKVEDDIKNEQPEVKEKKPTSRKSSKKSSKKSSTGTSKGKSKKSKVKYDLNNDGVFDEKDATIAAKTLAARKRKK